MSDPGKYLSVLTIRVDEGGEIETVLNVRPEHLAEFIGHLEACKLPLASALQAKLAASGPRILVPQVKVGPN